MDRIGTRKGYSISVVIWGLASMAHSLVRTPFGFGVARFALGIGEAGNFPAAIKTVAEWFPRKERALATGIFNSGTNFGAIIAPLAIPWIALRLGWRTAFLFTGVTDLIWLTFWLAMYRNPPSTRRCRAKSCSTFRATHQPRIRKYHFCGCWRSVRPGPTRSARSSPIPFGGSIFFGCQSISRRAAVFRFPILAFL